MNDYTCNALRAVTGDVIRPGGCALTERSVRLCSLLPGCQLLDVGCGMGTSVEFLRRVFHLDAEGVDPSAALLRQGKARWPNLPVQKGSAESLPFPDASFDAILCECSFSHFADRALALREFGRVLRIGGRLMVSDLYCRSASTTVDNILPDEATLRKMLPQHGFVITNWEDHSEVIKQLSVDLILHYGSLSAFREQCFASCPNCCFRQLDNDVKLGYFLMTAEKNNKFSKESANG